uniref:Beta-trefoil DNA-binding domain-containing protein n=1 Tax=Panagrolaimus sp. ES5 TaxID=591445 RepID=A0AC34F622_9BILA
MCRLSADLHLPNGSAIKGIQSGHIKVMSKGSKKTKIDPATANGSSSFIKNGSNIALFIRGPGTITRYLHCNPTGFCTSLKQWSIYKIYLVDEQTGETEFSYDSEEKFIYYQRNVLLVDTATEISLPIMKIRKCGHTENKVYKFENNSNEPVCPFHMISFEYIDTNGNLTYLGTQNNDKIGFKSLSDPSKGINNEVKWNVISADRYLYRFYPVNGLERISMLNFPIVLSINSIKVEDEWLEIKGRGFTKDIQVWFNTCPSRRTIYRSSSIITCVVPTLISYYTHCSNLRITETLTIPLYLVTVDGTIYPIPFIFVYNARNVGKIGHVKGVHEMDRNTTEQPVNL